MNKILIIVGMLLLSTMVEAQCYQDRMGKAKAAENAGNYREAKSYYSEATQCEDAKYHNNGEEARKGVARCNTKLAVLTVDGKTSLEESFSSNSGSRWFDVLGYKNGWTTESKADWCECSKGYLSSALCIKVEQNLTDYDREAIVVVSSGNSSVRIKVIQKKATAAEEYYRIGDAYSSGRTMNEKKIEEDVSKALEYYSKSAQMGFAEAQYRLGEWHYNGIGVGRDYKKAVEWYAKAAEQGHACAKLGLGTCYYYGAGVERDYQKAAEFYSGGHSGGCWSDLSETNLGECYYYGRGVDQDYKMAYELFSKAKEYARAQKNLGECYYYGHGVDMAYNEAVIWFTKSAEQGYARAQAYLGQCYYDGQGVDVDFGKAEEWYTKAAEQGDAWAQRNLGHFYSPFGGMFAPQDAELSVMWYTKAAEQGDAYSQERLGWCYEYDGHGVEPDYKKAVEWYTKSAEQGNKRAQYRLGWCYQYGQGVEKNIAKAVEWYAKSAKQGYEEAQKKLDELNVKY